MRRAIHIAVLGLGLALASCNSDPVYAQRAVPPAFAAHYRHHGQFALPDPVVTPGLFNPECVADTSKKPHMLSMRDLKGKSIQVEGNICADDFVSSAIRATIHNFAGLKKQACAEYGVTNCDASVEGDHLGPIELCGVPDSLKNIWPQPMDQAKVKDHQVEDVLPRLVCEGKMTLREAQECVTGDWVACGEARAGMGKKPKKRLAAP